MISIACNKKMDDNPRFQAGIPLRPLRNQSSYENMSDVTFADESDNQYDELHAHERRHRPRAVRDANLGDRNKPTTRKNNGVCQTKANEAANKAANKSPSYEGSREDASPKLFRMVAFVGFLIALAVFGALMLLSVGVLSLPSCHGCTDDLVPSSGQTSGLKQELMLVIKELSSNISELNAMVKSREEIISQLQARDVELTSEITELERKTHPKVLVVNHTKIVFRSLVGPRGPQGFAGAAGPRGEAGLDGKPGKRGPGNMTSCRSISREGGPFTVDASGVGHKVTVVEVPGYKILGVSCSTFGTAEKHFKSDINTTTNVRRYECTCRGQSKVFQAESGQAKCIMHYWVCPLTS